MRRRSLIWIILIVTFLMIPAVAQPGLPIVAENADALLLAETILAPGAVTSVAWSPDGTMIAYGTVDGLVWLENVGDNDNELPYFSGHDGSVESVAFSPDGAILYSSATDGEVRIWDVATGELLQRITASGTIYAVAVNPVSDDELAFAGDGGTIYQRAWTAPAGGNLPTLHSDNGIILDLDYSPQGDLLASAGDDGTLRLFDPTNSEQVAVESGFHFDAVTGLSFSPDGEQLASSSLDGTVWLRSASMDDDPIRLMTVPDNYAANAVDFGGLGDLVAVAGADTTVYLVTTPTEAYPTPEAVGYLVGHTDEVTDVAFSPLGTMLASASLDGSVKLWAVDTSIVFADAQAAPQVLCEGTPPSRMVVGQQGRSTIHDGSPLNVRQAPGGNVIMRLEEGESFTVIGGPQCSGDYTWWQIERPDGLVGWVAEGIDDSYFIEPLPEVTIEALQDAAPGVAGTAVIFGTVWHDMCDNTRRTEGEGCVLQNGAVVADGIPVPSEPGIRGVTVILGIGACPVDNILDTVQTDSYGQFEFSGLASGLYCVFVDPAMPDNAEVLDAGQWTWPPPLLDDGAAYYTIELQPDEMSPPADFGWDYQQEP